MNEGARFSEARPQIQARKGEALPRMNAVQAPSIY